MKHKYYIERVDLMDDEENNDIEIGSERFSELTICKDCANYLAGYCYLDAQNPKPTCQTGYCYWSDKRIDKSRPPKHDNKHHTKDDLIESFAQSLTYEYLVRAEAYAKGYAKGIKEQLKTTNNNCEDCKHYDAFITNLICRECSRSYRDKYCDT